MRPASLAARLAIGLSLGLALLWALGAAAALSALSRQTDALFDSAAQETAQRLLPLAAMDYLARDADGEADRAQRVAGAQPHRELLTYILRDEAGRVALASHDADPAVFPARVAAGFSSTPTHRLYAETAMRGALTLIVAEPLSLRRKAALRAARALALPALALVPLSLFGVWALVAWSFRPVTRLAAEIGARGGGDLRPLDARGLPSEMAPVAGAVDALMERVRRTLDAERRFAANAAHELRTPIAAALAQTQRLAAGAPDEATRGRAQAVAARLRDLAALAAKLMQLARAQGARLLLDAPVDCAPALRLVVEEARRADGLGDRLVAHFPDAPILSSVDPDALAILLRNLIENAARHGAPDAPVIARFAAGGFAVVNRGPAAPAETLAGLTRPFERGAGDAPGAGLGLAIAAAIARETGANLTLASPAPGADDGFEAAFAFPPPQA